MFPRLCKKRAFDGEPNALFKDSFKNILKFQTQVSKIKSTCPDLTPEVPVCLGPTKFAVHVCIL